MENLVTDPTAVSVFAGRSWLPPGWKPGFSTDNDAVVLAQRFSAGTVINLSNIAMVYSADPRKNTDARPLQNADLEGNARDRRRRMDAGEEHAF